jgi:hypothetical protein
VGRPEEQGLLALESPGWLAAPRGGVPKQEDRIAGGTWLVGGLGESDLDCLGLPDGKKRLTSAAKQKIILRKVRLDLYLQENFDKRDHR